jgi:hypothetical protein
VYDDMLWNVVWVSRTGGPLCISIVKIINAQDTIPSSFSWFRVYIGSIPAADYLHQLVYFERSNPLECCYHQIPCASCSYNPFNDPREQLLPPTGGFYGFGIEAIKFSSRNEDLPRYR